jgi:hypothetical protein
MGLVKIYLLADFTGVQEFSRFKEDYFFLMKNRGSLHPDESIFLPDFFMTHKQL